MMKGIREIRLNMILVLICVFVFALADVAVMESASEPVHLNPGDYVTFGQYFQTDENGSEKEPVEWLVMDQQGEYIFVVSRYALNVMAFNETMDGTAWGNSTLREWLNNDFLQTAFTADEQEAIQVTEVDLSEAQGQKGWNSAGRAGGSTQDKIFLPSSAEVEQYLLPNGWHLCPVTAYSSGAEQKGAKTVDGQKTCLYWLRNAAFKNNAGVVDATGKINTSMMNYKFGAVRPVMWVDINAVKLQ